MRGASARLVSPTRCCKRTYRTPTLQNFTEVRIARYFERVVLFTITWSRDACVHAARAASACCLASRRPPSPPPRGSAGTPPANARSPVVSPDGRRILFTSERADAAGLYVVNADGTGALRISPDAAAAGRAVWSTDGSRLLFGRIARDTIRVLSMLANGSTVSALAALHVPGARAVTVSPDASRIVYGVGPWTAMQLYAVVDGGLHFGSMNGMRPMAMVVSEGKLTGNVLEGRLWFRGVRLPPPMPNGEIAFRLVKQ